MVDLAKDDGHNLMFRFLGIQRISRRCCGQEVACTSTICIFVEISGTNVPLRQKTWPLLLPSRLGSTMDPD